MAPSLAETIEYTDFSDIHDRSAEMFEGLAQDLARQKEKILLSKLKEMGISAPLLLQENKRFKDFIREVHGNEETYYYNDGSNEGHRIVTFVKDDKISFDRLSITTNTSFF